jgi:hypothetical protein
VWQHHKIEKKTLKEGLGDKREGQTGVNLQISLLTPSFALRKIGTS